MWTLEWLLKIAGIAVFGSAASVVGYDVYLALQFQRVMNAGRPGAGRDAAARRPALRISAGRAPAALRAKARAIETARGPRDDSPLGRIAA